MIRRFLSSMCGVALLAGAILSVGSSLEAAVTISVDPNMRRTLEGVSEFDRSRFVVLHASHTDSEWDSPEMQDQFLNGWDVYLGRDVGLASWWFGEVKEDPARPGFPSVAHIAELAENFRNNYSTRTDIHAYEDRTTLVTSTHVIPFYPHGWKTRQGWAPADATATGLFLGHFFKEFFGDRDGVHGQPKPRYFEVINEPDWELIEASYAPDDITYQDIWDYHATIAREIRKLNGDDVKVGGFCATSMTYGEPDMAYWKETWDSFMKSVGAEMDFVSLHLYDKGWNEGNQYLRVGARVGAQLDLTEQAGYLFAGGVKPMIISEYGAVDPTWNDKPYSAHRDWIINKATIGMLMQFMERPHLIEKAVPFILLKALWWNDPSGQPYAFRLLREDGNGNWVYTDIAKLYEFLSELKGRRVYSRADDVDIQVDAFVSGNRLYVIANNLEHADVQVVIDPADWAGGAVTGGWVKHLHAVDGITTLDREEFSGARTNFTIGAQGAIIVAFDYPGTVRPRETCEEKKYYTDAYLRPIAANTAITFSIDGVATAEQGDAWLRLGLSRAHGKSLQPTVVFNGTPLAVPTDFRGYDQRWWASFWGVLEIPVPIELVQAHNTVSVTFPDDGGTLTSATMRVLGFVDRRPPQVTLGPADMRIGVGGSGALSVVASGVSLEYQWFKDDVAIPGATGPMLRLENADAADAGNYHVTVSNPWGSVSSGTATVTVAGSPAEPVDPVLRNLSTRGRTGGAAGELIAGFVIEGEGAKEVLIRAVGPGLAGFGVTEWLEDPVLELFDGAGRSLLVNNDWMDDPEVGDANAVLFGSAGAFELDALSRDAVLRVALPAGPYTAIVSAGRNGEGVAMVEVYDLDPGAPARLVNVSTRGYVGRDDDSLIGGFVIQGTNTMQILARGVGPKLYDFGVTEGFVADPVLTIADGGGSPIFVNDDWAADGAAVDEIVRLTGLVGAFDLTLNSGEAAGDAAVAATIGQGSYTAIVRAGDAAGGNGMVELYRADE